MMRHIHLKNAQISYETRVVRMEGRSRSLKTDPSPSMWYICAILSGY